MKHLWLVINVNKHLIRGEWVWIQTQRWVGLCNGDTAWREERYLHIADRCCTLMYVSSDVTCIYKIKERKRTSVCTRVCWVISQAVILAGPKQDQPCLKADWLQTAGLNTVLSGRKARPNQAQSKGWPQTLVVVQYLDVIGSNWREGDRVCFNGMWDHLAPIAAI